MDHDATEDVARLPEGLRTGRVTLPRRSSTRRRAAAMVLAELLQGTTAQ